MRNIEKGIEEGKKIINGTRRELMVGECQRIYKMAYNSNDILGNLLYYGFLFGVSAGYRKGRESAKKRSKKA